jgi:hypothetical protein
MQGHPPPHDKRVSRENFMAAPYNRWSLQHIDELQPTRNVHCESGPVVHFERREQDLGSLTETVRDGRTLSVDDWLRESYTDAFLVLHDGEIVYERYFNDQTPATRHLMFSVTKSFTATMLLALMADSEVNSAAPITEYLPELGDSVYHDATVQQVLDMTVAVDFDEDYADPTGAFAQYGAVFGIGLEPSTSRDIHQYLGTLHKRGSHGNAFQYVTPNTEVLGWLVRRTTGTTLARALQDTIWSKLGCEHDAYYWLDAAGNEMAGAGLNVTLRDAARFGQMILSGGAFNGQQIVPAASTARILEPGDPAPFNRYHNDPWYEEIGFAYHDQWWTYADPHRLVGGIGIHGQFITLDKATGTVIVKQSSDPEADGLSNATHGPQMMYAISNHLGGR